MARPKLCVVIYDISETGSVDDQADQHCDTWVVRGDNPSASPGDLIDGLAEALAKNPAVTFTRHEY